MLKPASTECMLKSGMEMNNLIQAYNSYIYSLSNRYYVNSCVVIICMFSLYDDILCTSLSIKCYVL